MRTHLSEKLESGRVRRGVWATTRDDGPNGIFIVRGPHGDMIELAAESGDGKSPVLVRGVRKAAHPPTGWEHVCVTPENRTPTWEEMCFAKDLFWNEEECVVQYHPARSQYVKAHEHRLH